MFADIGGVPAVMTKHEGGDHDRSFGWGWIFALVIIFLALVFLWGRKDDGRNNNTVDAVIPLAAAKMMDGGHNGHGHDWNESHREHWDILRDEGQHYSNMRYDMAKQGWELTREMDQNTFRILQEQEHTKAEIAASERRILEKVEQDKYERVRDERDAYRQEATNLRFHWRPFHGGGFPCPPDAAYAG